MEENKNIESALTPVTLDSFSTADKSFEDTMVILPKDKESIQKEVEIEKGIDLKALPDGDEKNTVTNEIDVETANRFNQEYYNSINANKNRLFADIIHNTIPQTPDMKDILLGMGFTSLQEFVQQKRPQVFADNALSRKLFDNGINVFYNASIPEYSPASPSQQTSLFTIDGEIKDFYTAEKVAIDKQFYINEKGEQRPFSELSKYDKLDIAYDDTIGYHYKKGNWDELTENDIRSVWGTQYGEDPNLFSTAVMGVVNGFVGKSMYGLGYISSLFGFEKTKNILYNFGRSLNYTSKGIQDEWSLQNMTYYTFDGIGQVIPIFIAMNTMPELLIAKFGMTSQQAFNTTMWTTRLFMGAEAGGAVSDQLIKMGVPEKEAKIQALTYFGAAIASESLFATNFLEKLAYTKSYKNNFIKDVILESFDKAGINYAKTAAGKSYLVNSKARSMFSSFDSPVVKYLGSLVEEPLEEMGENIMTASVAPMQNAMMYHNAKSRTELYDDNSFYEKNGKYYIKTKNGDITSLPQDEWETAKKEYINSFKMLDNSVYLGEDYNFSEAVYAGLSTAIVGAFGLPANISAKKAINKQKKSNTSLAILAKHMADNPANEQKIFDTLEKMVANGLFSAYNIDKDGNPATVSSENYVAKDMVTNFMNTLKLMSKAMNVYGMTQKEAIEAYQGDIEIFTSLADTVTKMQQINTAINSGDIKSNLVQGLIEENDTTETLTEKLKQLQDKYTYLSVPEEGKKHSKAYNDKMFEIYLQDNFIDKKIKDTISNNRYGKMFKDLSDTEQASVVTELKKTKTAYTNQVGFVDLLKQFYNIEQMSGFAREEDLTSMYKNLSDTIFGNKNLQSAVAKNIFENHNKVLEQKKVKKSQDEVDEVIKRATDKISKITDIKGKISDSGVSMSKSDVEAFANDIDSVMEDYNTLLANEKTGEYQVGNTLKKIKGNIQQILPIAGELEALQLQDLLETDQAGLLTTFGKLGNVNFDELSSADLGTMKMGYVDTSNITPEQTNVALEEFAKNPMKNLLYNDVSMGTTLMEFMERTDGDNVVDARGEKHIGEGIKGILNYYNDFMIIEDEVIPIIEADPETKESSPKYNTNTRRFSKSEIENIRKVLKTNIASVEDRIEKLRSMGSNKEFGQRKRHIIDLMQKFNTIKSITTTSAFSDAEHDKLQKATSEMIDSVVKEMSNLGSEISSKLNVKNDYSDNKYNKEPLMYLFEKFTSKIGDDALRNDIIKKSLWNVEAAILKTEEAMSGKLTRYMEHFVKVNSLNSVNMMSNTTFEDFSGIPVFDYESNEINRNGEFLIDPTRVPGDLDTAVEHDNKYIKNTVNFQILQYMDMVNTIGNNGVPSMKSILNSFNNFSTAMTSYTNDITDQKKGVPKNLYTPTYEQRQAILHMIVNAKRNNLPFYSKLGNNDKVNLRSIYLRGYAGAGKTTIVVPYYIGIMADLKKSELGVNKTQMNVTVFAPTENLLKDHEYGSMYWLEEVMDKMSVDLNTIYLPYKDDLKGLDYSDNLHPDSDVIIVDEATKMGLRQSGSNSMFTANSLAETISNFQTVNQGNKTAFVLIGDDSQVSIDEINNVSSKPISRFSDKTIPITEVHRSSIQSISKLQDYFRNVVFGNINISETFVYNEDYGVELKGTLESVMDSFVSWYNKNNQVGNSLTAKDASIIVAKNSDKNSIISKYKSVVPTIADHIYTLKDWENVTTNDAAGLSSKNVFVYYDFEKELLNTKQSEKINNRMQKSIYDMMLTSVSRAINKVTIVSQKLSNEQNLGLKPLIKSAESMFYEFNPKNIELQAELSVLSKNLKVTNKENVIINNGKEFGDFTSQYRSESLVDEKSLNDAIKKTETALIEKEQSSRISELVFGNKNVNESESRLMTSIYKNVMNLYNEKLNNATDIEKYSNLIDQELDKLDALIRERDPNTTFNKEAHKSKILSTQLPQLLANGMINGYSIPNPIMNTTVNGVKYSANPMMISVVGEYNGKPIIDIYDVAYYSKDDGIKETSKQMMLYTIKAAIDNGFIVNNSVLQIFTKDKNSNLVQGGTHTFSHDYIKNNLVNWLSFDVENIDSYFADDQAYYNNQREQLKDFGKDKLYSGNNMITIDKKTKYYDGTNFVIEYHYTDNKGNQKIMNQKEYSELLTPKERYEKIGLFKSGAEIWDKSKSFHSTSHDTITNIGNRVIKRTLTDEEYSAVRSELLNKAKTFTQKIEKDISYIGNDGKSHNDEIGIVNYISNEVITSVSKKMNIAKEVIIDNGLDFIVSTMPELGYVKYSVDGKRELQRVDKILGALFNKYISEQNDVLAKETLDEIVANMTFSPDMDENMHNLEETKLEEIAKLNTEKNKALLAHLRNLNLYGQQKVSITENKTFTANKEVKMTDFLSSLSGEVKDFKLTRQDVELKDRTTIEKYTFTLDSANDNRILKGSTVLFYAKSAKVIKSNSLLDAKKDVSLYSESLIDSINEHMNSLQGIFDNKNLDKGAKKDAVSNIMKSFRDSEAMAFIVHNINTGVMDSRYVDVVMNITDKYINKKAPFNSASIKSTLTSAKGIIKGINDNVQNSVDLSIADRLLKPVYFNNKYNAENIIVTNGIINSPALFLKPESDVSVSDNPTTDTVVEEIIINEEVQEKTDEFNVGCN